MTSPADTATAPDTTTETPPKTGAKDITSTNPLIEVAGVSAGPSQEEIDAQLQAENSGAEKKARQKEIDKEDAYAREQEARMAKESRIKAAPAEEIMKPFVKNWGLEAVNPEFLSLLANSEEKRRKDGSYAISAQLTNGKKLHYNSNYNNKGEFIYVYHYRFTSMTPIEAKGIILGALEKGMHKKTNSDGKPIPLHLSGSRKDKEAMWLEAQCLQPPVAVDFEPKEGSSIYAKLKERLDSQVEVAGASAGDPNSKYMPQPAATFKLEPALESGMNGKIAELKGKGKDVLAEKLTVARDALAAGSLMIPENQMILLTDGLPALEERPGTFFGYLKLPKVANIDVDALLNEKFKGNPPIEPVSKNFDDFAQKKITELDNAGNKQEAQDMRIILDSAKRGTANMDKADQVAFIEAYQKNGLYNVAAVDGKTPAVEGAIMIWGERSNIDLEAARSAFAEREAPKQAPAVKAEEPAAEKPVAEKPTEATVSTNATTNTTTAVVAPAEAKEAKQTIVIPDSKIAGGGEGQNFTESDQKWFKGQIENRQNQRKSHDVAALKAVEQSFKDGTAKMKASDFIQSFKQNQGHLKAPIKQWETASGLTAPKTDVKIVVNKNKGKGPK